jgi:hypothetical protein
MKHMSNGGLWREVYKRWIPSVLLLPVCLYVLATRGKYLLIDHFNLLVHEGGHGVFLIFGGFMYYAGGTLMQIILPSLIIWYFFGQGYIFGVQLFTVWLGQNFVNISVYAADARERALPLLGGSGVIHDWNYMLGKLGLLNHDHIVGYFFVGLAVITFIVALIIPLIMRDIAQ